MSIAFIPSPSQGVWHLGAIPIRAYALCIIAGVIVAVWVAERRYRVTGGRPGLILDVATWAVPFGLVGARIYHVITDPELYFAAGRDWVGIFKIWDGGIGIPGAISLGAVGAWIACRRAGVRLGPVAGAAAPGIALAQAIGRWGNWFNQELYGRPSKLPWALQISPEHRPVGLENVATYQPTFLYESLWDVGVALLVIWAARRFLLTGDRTFALYVAAYGVGRFITESLRIDFAHHIAGLRVNQWMAIIIFAGGVAYLYRTRHKIGPDVIGGPLPATASPAATAAPPSPAAVAAQATGVTNAAADVTDATDVSATRDPSAGSAGQDTPAAAEAAAEPFASRAGDEPSASTTAAEPSAGSGAPGSSAAENGAADAGLPTPGPGEDSADPVAVRTSTGAGREGGEAGRPEPEDRGEPAGP